APEAAIQIARLKRTVAELDGELERALSVIDDMAAVIASQHAERARAAERGAACTGLVSGGDLGDMGLTDLVGARPESYPHQPEGAARCPPPPNRSAPTWPHACSSRSPPWRASARTAPACATWPAAAARPAAAPTPPTSACGPERARPGWATRSCRP